MLKKLGNIGNKVTDFAMSDKGITIFGGATLVAFATGVVYSVVTLVQFTAEYVTFVKSIKS
jgi:hypothetical protein